MTPEQPIDRSPDILKMPQTPRVSQNPEYWRGVEAALFLVIRENYNPAAIGKMLAECAKQLGREEGV